MTRIELILGLYLRALRAVLYALEWVFSGFRIPDYEVTA